MSIGIAAICQNGEAAVLASDRQVTRLASAPSEQAIRYDGVQKLIRCSDTVVVQVASNEMAATSAVRDLVETSLSDGSASDCAKAIAEALLTCQQSKAETSFIATLGVGYDGIQNLLANSRPDAALKGFVDAWKESKIQIEVLVTGWSDQKNKFETLIVAPESSLQPHDNRTPYTAVGSGAWIALPVLSYRGLDLTAPVQHAVLAVYEAKRIGEAVPGVGPATDLVVMRRGQRAQSVDVESLERIADGIRHWPFASTTLSDVEELISQAPNEGAAE